MNLPIQIRYDIEFENVGNLQKKTYLKKSVQTCTTNTFSDFGFHW